MNRSLRVTPLYVCMAAIAHSRRDKRRTTHIVRNETNRIAARKMQPRSLSLSRDTTASAMAIGDDKGLLAADVVLSQSTSLVGEEAICILCCEGEYI